MCSYYHIKLILHLSPHSYCSYNLNTYNFYCQTYLTKAEGKKEKVLMIFGYQLASLLRKADTEILSVDNVF